MWTHVPGELRDLSALINSKNIMKLRHDTFQSNVSPKKKSQENNTIPNR